MLNTVTTCFIYCLKTTLDVLFIADAMVSGNVATMPIALIPFCSSER